jgi:hypothetical protein
MRNARKERAMSGKTTLAMCPENSDPFRFQLLDGLKSNCPFAVSKYTPYTSASVCKYDLPANIMINSKLPNIKCQLLNI